MLCDVSACDFWKRQPLFFFFLSSFLKRQNSKVGKNDKELKKRMLKRTKRMRVLHSMFSNISKVLKESEKEKMESFYADSKYRADRTCSLLFA